MVFEVDSLKSWGDVLGNPIKDLVLLFSDWSRLLALVVVWHVFLELERKLLALISHHRWSRPLGVEATRLHLLLHLLGTHHDVKIVDLLDVRIMALLHGDLGWVRPILLLMRWEALLLRRVCVLELGLLLGHEVYRRLWLLLGLVGLLELEKMLHHLVWLGIGGVKLLRAKGGLLRHHHGLEVL